MAVTTVYTPDNLGDSEKKISTFDRIKPILSQYPTIHGEELIEAVNDLESLVGLDSIKKAVWGQIAYGIMLLDRPKSGKNRHMLHTMITGPPGVGKSNLAYILGRIWSALGIVGRKQMGRKDLHKDQEMVLHLSRNMEFIHTKAEVIKSHLPSEALAICDEYRENTVGDRIDWIVKLTEESIEEAKYVEELLEAGKSPIKFRKVTRADLIGKWQGHTAQKTLQILNDSLGGVLFIDEAYQLITSHDGNNDDNFGAECLTTLNEFMSEHPDEIIIIMAGYQNNMEETIFRIQPGLKRRFMWCFNIEPYSNKELTSIIRKQAQVGEWILAENVTDAWLQDVVASNIKYFPNYGGDTDRLIFYASISYACKRLYDPDLQVNILSQDHILDGIVYLKENDCKNDTGPPPELYN